MSQVAESRQQPLSIDSLLQQVSDFVLLVDAQGCVLWANQRAESVLGGRKPLVGSVMLSRLAGPVQDFSAIVSQFQTQGPFVQRLRAADGTQLSLRWRAIEARPEGWLLLLEDISESQPFRDELVSLKEQIQLALFSVADAVILTDERGMVTALNPSARSLLNVGAHSAVGVEVCNLFTLFNGESHQPLPCLVRDALTRGRLSNASSNAQLFVSGEEPMAVDAMAAPFRDGQRRVAGCVLVFRDASGSRRTTARMNWQATHDGLTQLPNRLQFEAELAREVARAKCGNAGHGLMVIDVYQMRVINETCGQAGGDQLLVQLAQTLAASLRRQDVLARIGSDEFGVLLRGATLAGTQRVADAMIQSVQALCFEWDGQRIKAAISIGAMAVDLDTESESQALAAATAASEAAREAGRNRIHLHHNLNSAAVERRRSQMHWVGKITSALAEDRLVLYAQPLVPVAEPHARISHVEVLVRMLDDDGKLVAPGQFLPAAERFGLMDEIDRTVLIKVVEFIERCPDKRVSFGVNLSGTTISDETFAQFVHSEIEASGIDPSRLHFEITETAAVANFRSAVRLIKSLRGLGCKFYLDDFGSGLSSFGYLRDLPVDFLKIDGSFVRAMTPGSIDLAMVSSINHLAGVIGLKTVAEYVENAEVLGLLQDIGVDYAQGYFFSPPKPLEALLGLTRERTAHGSGG